MTSTRSGRSRRARRHLLVAGFVLAYLAAGAMTLALGDRVVGGGWLAPHLVLLGAGMGSGLWLAALATSPRVVDLDGRSAAWSPPWWPGSRCRP
jgi:hypothetical protein